MVSDASYLMFSFVAVGAWAAEWYRILWFACALTFPTAVLSGVLFTFIGAALKRQVGEDTRTAAWTVLANTTGGMIGPPVAAFMLLPVLGWSVRSSRWLSCTPAWGCSRSDCLPGARPAASQRRSGGAGRARHVSIRIDARTTSRGPSGSMRTTVHESSRHARARSETIVLMRKAWMEKPLFHRLVTNSFSMSGTQVTGKRYMRYFAYWPMLVHHDATPACARGLLRRRRHRGRGDRHPVGGVD